MARRVSWTNNSSGHLGTYVYRAATLDPQNLPAPVATVAPVAQGETAEWIDDSGAYECYAVQDYDASGVSLLSGEVCVTDPWANVQIGDEVGGGIYGGTHTDGTNTWHLIFALSPSIVSNLAWHNDLGSSPSGVEDLDDGLSNQSAIIGDHPDSSGANAFSYCENYVDGAGNADYYLPALNELVKLRELSTNGHPEYSGLSISNNEFWSSTGTQGSWPYTVNIFYDGVFPENNVIKQRQPNNAAQEVNVIPVRRLMI